MSLQLSGCSQYFHRRFWGGGGEGCSFPMCCQNYLFGYRSSTHAKEEFEKTSCLSLFSFYFGGFCCRCVNGQLWAYVIMSSIPDHIIQCLEVCKNSRSFATMLLKSVCSWMLHEFGWHLIYSKFLPLFGCSQYGFGGGRGVHFLCGAKITFFATEEVHTPKKSSKRLLAFLSFPSTLEGFDVDVSRGSFGLMS